MESPLETLVRASVKNPLEEEIAAINGIFSQRDFEKGVLFKKNGSVSKELAFIVKGSARAVIINSMGNEITNAIIEKNHFLADLISVRDSSATAFMLQFLEDSTALVASINAHRKLLETNLAYNILIREHLADEAAKYSKRQILFLTGSAKERYAFIVSNYPNLLKEFPLKFIANMIGVTPTQLSRLRKKV